MPLKKIIRLKIQLFDIHLINLIYLVKVFDSFVEFIQKNARQANGGPGGGISRMQGKCLAVKLQRIVIFSLTKYAQNI